MEVTSAFLADYALIAVDGKLSIMGIFEAVNPPALPFQLPQMYMVIRWQAGPSEFGTEKTIRVVLMDSDAAELLSLEQHMTVAKPERSGVPATMVQLVMLAGVNFSKAGDYVFAVQTGGDEKRTIPFLVNEPPQGVG